MKLSVIKRILSMLIMLSSLSAEARGVYQTDSDFLSETFNGEVPTSKVVWVKADVAQTLANILGHNYVGLRIRYWKNEVMSAWILEEIGKDKPITFGVVISEQKIVKMEVLAFRESRGDEIRYPAFTQQFEGALLNEMKLNRSIDGISGATLSVWAMTSVARMALYLDSFINLD
jgi:hypothetical protein